MELRVGGKYKITKRLGFGAFGDIFSGINCKTNEEIAVKLVSNDQYNSTYRNFLTRSDPSYSTSLRFTKCCKETVSDPVDSDLRSGHSLDALLWSRGRVQLHGHGHSWSKPAKLI